MCGDVCTFTNVCRLYKCKTASCQLVRCFEDDLCLVTFGDDRNYNKLYVVIEMAYTGTSEV